MNEILKQRLVGTMVITALAAIFIPMLFDDPIEGADSYSNELSIPDEPLEIQAMQSQLDSIPRSRQEITSRAIPAQVNLQSQKITTAIKTDTHLKSWTIQIGSFGNKQNALEFRDKLRQQKFTAFVDTAPSSNGKLFRLRVGPEINKKVATKNQKRLEKLYSISTLLVSE